MASILIVDDSPTEVHVLRSMLERHAFQVLSAHSAQEGIAAARKEHPDLILMDIVMPGLNGFQAIRQLKENASTSAIPVIIVTTKNQETDRVWGLRQGAREYLTKPIEEANLVSKINAVLAS